MAGKVKQVDTNELMRHAIEYCDNCIANTTEVVAASGKVVKRRDRHIPTIGYFLLHWLRRERFDFYKRHNWYTAMRNESHPYSHTIKEINNMFDDLARDIVANEGKGIFYAKNKLNMHDKQHLNGEHKVVITFDGDVNSIK
jgi:hypothetical protein